LKLGIHEDSTNRKKLAGYLRYIPLEISFLDFLSWISFFLQPCHLRVLALEGPQRPLYGEPLLYWQENHLAEMRGAS